MFDFWNEVSCGSDNLGMPPGSDCNLLTLFILAVMSTFLKILEMMQASWLSQMTNRNAKPGLLERM